MGKLKQLFQYVGGVIAVVGFLGSGYTAYGRLQMKIEEYEKTIASLETKTGNLERAVIELTVELRTRGVIHETLPTQ